MRLVNSVIEGNPLAPPPIRPLCPVVLACDGGYAAQLATALRSMADSNADAWPLDVHVMVKGFSEELRANVVKSLPDESISIRWIEVDLSAFQHFGTMTYISPMTFARILVPQVFSQSVSRVLYLDADILVLNSLRMLSDADLEGRIVGAVVDALDSQIKSHSPGLDGVPRVQNYFNAGVLLIDLNAWRTERVSERALSYLSTNPRSPFSDQDALNVACDGYWKSLDPHWNFQSHLEVKLSSFAPGDRPAIVHFVTSMKPWKPAADRDNARFYDLFRSRTEFRRGARERAADVARAAWHRVKEVLGRSELLQQARHGRAARRRAAEPSRFQ